MFLQFFYCGMIIFKLFIMYLIFIKLLFLDRGKEKELSANLEVSSVVSSLNTKLSELRSQSEIISKHSKALQRCLTELETIDIPPDVSTKIKAWMERANLIRIASVGMVTVSI